MYKKHFRSATAVAIASILIVGSAQAKSFKSTNVVRTDYDGITNDLLTGGLGKTGLQAAEPTVDLSSKEGRRTLAIHYNYNSLVDTTEPGGYGRLYGPNVTADGAATSEEGLVGGSEFLVLNKHGVTMMVQIPSTFDVNDACIVTAPSSGSRGIYGAIGTAGEWGLKKGCAVAYTDKGTGMGIHDLEADTVHLIDGARAVASDAGKDSNFRALRGSKLNHFKADYPNRVAYKHAHSKKNAERNWGRDVNHSIKFAFWAIKSLTGERMYKNNTLVIGSSVSNGGASSILAAEQKNLIDGVAVAEPNVNPKKGDFGIQVGSSTANFDHSKSLMNYTAMRAIYQPCASKAVANLTAPFNFTAQALADQRCASLADKGLLNTTTVEEQREEAQTIINDYGFMAESNHVLPSHEWLKVDDAIAITYANQYGRFGVEDNLCGLSFGSTDAATGTLVSAVDLTNSFSKGNGIPPTNGINLVVNGDAGTGKHINFATSTTGFADMGLDQLLCIRSLALGYDAVTGEALSGTMKKQAKSIKKGVKAIRATGDINVPLIYVAGRADGIIPLNFAARPYFGLASQHGARVSYIEVTHAQHLDAFNKFAGFDVNYVPLHHYFIQAMDLMYDHLKSGSALPPSQVVRTIPRGVDSTTGEVPQLELANLPEISFSPADDEIRFQSNTVIVPE